MTPKERYDAHIGDIQRIAAYIGRRNHLAPQDVEEFTQEVLLRLLENDCAIIGKFKELSEFTTYLTTVIGRLFQQRRVEMWGKWRPSAEAKRLGDKAIVLERYMSRDGYTFAEAVKVLTTPEGAQYTEIELEQIYVRLPPRTPRPMEVSGDVMPDAATIDADAFDRVEMAERERDARRTAKAIDSAIQQMDVQDRQILHMRFAQALKVPDIARRLRIEQKKVYKRLDTLFGRMRKKLEAAGLHRSEIGSLLNTDTDLRCNLLRGDEEMSSRGPSHLRGGGGRV